jgi:hypothetical protein
MELKPESVPSITITPPRDNTTNQDNNASIFITIPTEDNG